MLVLGGLSFAVWMSVKTMIVERNQEGPRQRCELFATVLALEARDGGEAAVLARLRSDASMRGGARLEVWQSDGRLLCADPTPPAMASSEHLQSHAFAAHCAPGGELRACYTVDDARDAEMGTRWAWAPALVTLGAGAAVAAGASWHVRRQLRPLNVLAAQTRSISPRRLDQRLALADPAEELRP